MQVKLTMGGKIALGAIAASLIGFGVFQARDKIFPPAPTKNSVVPPKADLPSLNPDDPGNGDGADIQLAGSEPGCTDKPEVRFLVWAWNAQMGMMYANGGPQASQGSLMCKNGVNLKLIREDDVGKMQEALVSMATELSQGKAQPTKGAHYVAIMGDGSATFLKGLNDTLERLGSEYRAKVVGSAGYSRGEDQFMGLPEWKSNPASSAGGLVAGYLRDGDWNIAMKWLGDNGLCNNPDEKTYDPSCLNWVAADTYIDASEKYVANYCETRPVVKEGRRTGENKKVCVNGVVTWTPGDVIVAQKRGGLATIASTREYSSQMPNTIIGIDKWMKSNRPKVEGMLKAIFDGGDQVKRNPAAMQRAAEISQAVYKESGADADYWVKYFKGVTETDKTGLKVSLGGSSVNNLADNMLLYGLAPGSSNLFAATYKVFGDIVVDQYPELVPSYAPVQQVLDTSYIQALAKRSAPNTKAAMPKYVKASGTKQQMISRKSWQITFQSGQASFTPAASKVLDQLFRDLLVAGGTTIEIHGHTDNVGNPQDNMNLSEERAFAVKQWLQKKSGVNFPDARVQVFAHGQSNPVAPNSSEANRNRNRRVEIVLRAAGGT